MYNHPTSLAFQTVALLIYFWTTHCTCQGIERSVGACHIQRDANYTMENIRMENGKIRSVVRFGVHNSTINPANRETHDEDDEEVVTSNHISIVNLENCEQENAQDAPHELEEDLKVLLLN